MQGRAGGLRSLPTETQNYANGRWQPFPKQPISWTGTTCASELKFSTKFCTAKTQPSSSGLVITTSCLNGLAICVWSLWHGKAQEVMQRLQVMLKILKRALVKVRSALSLIRKLTLELLKYLQNNADSLPNYGQRWRNGQRISSAFVESAVNQIIDKRMSKSQQMRWDPQSAHQLLQVRVRVLDGLLRDDFSRWYPGLPANESSMVVVA